MSSVNLLKTNKSVPVTINRLSLAVVMCVALPFISSTAMSDEILVDEVTIAAIASVETGVVIEVPEQSELTSGHSVNATNTESSGDVLISEYKRGKSLVREYRIRGQWFYIEIFPESGNNPYVIVNLEEDLDPNRRSAGILLNRW